MKRQTIVMGIATLLMLSTSGRSLCAQAVSQKKTSQLGDEVLEAGRAAIEWIDACRTIDREMVSTLGLTGLMGGFTKAPFDVIGDTLRGTRAIMLDKFRHPKAVLTAVDRLVPIEAGVHSASEEFAEPDRFHATSQGRRQLHVQ